MTFAISTRVNLNNIKIFLGLVEDMYKYLWAVRKNWALLNTQRLLGLLEDMSVNIYYAKYILQHFILFCVFFFCLFLFPHCSSATLSKIKLQGKEPYLGLKHHGIKGTIIIIGIRERRLAWRGTVIKSQNL